MNRLRIARMSRGLQQKELAAKLSVTQATLSRWERGTVSPESRYLSEIALVLDYTTDYLMGLSSETSASVPQFAPAAESTEYSTAINGMTGLMRDLPENDRLELLAVAVNHLKSKRAG